MNHQHPRGTERAGTRSEPAAIKQLMRDKRKAAGVLRFADRRAQLADYYERHGIRTPEQIYGPPPYTPTIPRPTGPDYLAPVLQYLDKLLSPNRYA